MKTADLYNTLRHGFAPKTVLAGLALSLVGLCVLGRRDAHTNHLKSFVHFTMWTSPETKYYPTVNEMMSLVRARTKPGQIVVIVGGNSILRGVGQPPDHIWTKFLQENLGDGYAVFDFAFDGSGITDGGAVVAEALRREFPRQIYIANAAPAQAPAPDGSGTYRFVFWDAYYKGLLIDDPARTAAIVTSNRTAAIENPAGAPGLRELKAREWLDSYLYFQDFWNRVTYDDFNTVWGFYMPGLTGFLRPRKSYPDPEPDRSLDPIPARYPAASLAAEMINVRGCSEFTYGTVDATGFHERKDASGRWTLYQPKWDEFMAGIKVAMPDVLKPRTLILMSRSSPYYTRLLTPDERERDDLAYAHAVEMWKAGGYDSIEYGKNFTADEFADRTHLTWQGGAKLAAATADKVREMSQKIGYLQK